MPEILPNFWKKWKYPYLTGVFISILLAIILLENQTFKDWLLNLGTLEYIGALIAGMLFVSSFTAAISIVVIAIMTENINPMALGLIGGVGAVMGDYLVFKLVRSHLQEELAMLFGREETSHIKTLLRSKYIAWTLPIIGVFIIASPLPDELGVSLLGISKMSEARFILISYLSNSVGILMIASVAKVL
ncbi:hypothetical protein HYT18_03325 [Candidatus Microgenomates bacterium]|nr:hypothetical protein [Candidatus Microgenomates bacterium]